MKYIILITFIAPILILGQALTNSSNLDIEKSWGQEPQGWTYEMNLFVPNEIAPADGFPVCILLHGNGGEAVQFINE